ncbi:MAG: hypothetical protein R3B67_06950 [Phycisphaerales bacterium]
MHPGTIHFGLIVAITTGSASADIYRMRMSGAIEQVIDNRTSINDPFEGTALDVDDFTVSVGDEWTYEVIFDTDISPSDYMAGHHSIYGAQFLGSISIEGREVSMPGNFLYYYLDDNGSVDYQLMEVWGYVGPNGEAGVYSSFVDYDMVSMLINDGEVVDNEAMFDGIDVWNFGIYSNDIDTLQWVAGDGPFTITVEQIPSPGTLAVVSLCGVLASRRRR